MRLLQLKRRQKRGDQSAFIQETIPEGTLALFARRGGKADSRLYCTSYARYVSVLLEVGV